MNDYPKYLIFSLFFLFLLPADMSFAQNGSNPFELKHRLKETTIKVEESAPRSEKEATPPARPSNPFELEYRLEKIPATTVIPQSANPFDRTGRPAVKEAVEPKATLTPEASGAADSRNSFIFWTILGMLIFFTLSFSMYKPYYQKAYRAFTNENFLKLVQREQGGIIQVPFLILYLVFIINLGVFLYLCIRFFGYLAADDIRILTLLIAVTGGLFFLKHLALRFMAVIFPLSKEIRQYSFTITIFSIMIGLILAPMNTFIAYAPESIVPELIYTTLIIIALIYLFRSLRGLFIGSRYIAMHKFHFFMYLCTVEIAPIFILLKIVMLTAEIQ